MHKILKYIVVSVLFFAGFAVTSKAQFKEDAFSQTYNDQADTTGRSDTTDKLFSFKEFFGGLSHKHDLKIGTMFAGSVIMPGTAQIYNKQYWKLPIVYGGIGALAGTGGYYLHQYKKSGNMDLQAKNTGTWLMVGAGMVYWGSLMDGVASYKSAREPNPGRAALYSALLPGLGQIYNGEYFKVPIYWGCLLGATHFLMNNNTNYKRFKRIHNEATTDPNYSQSISAETAKWYRDEYRRYRDYSIVATALFYFLQVIDANVFAYMHDFEVTDDITMNIEPSVIAPDNVYAMHTSTHLGQNAVGLRLGIRF
ncbi:MAG: hypothetical protein IKW11_03840 [Bacteroidales bacterium]|nr:hypothetical protein [Bacteroidales bacterium]